MAIRVLQDLANPSLNSRVLSTMVLNGGNFLVKLYKDAIDSGRPGWPPLSRMTIEMKGHSKPLVGATRSEIRDGIKVIHQRENASIGIPEGAITAGGDKLDVIAVVQEFGAVISVTGKMRRWFASQGYPLRKDTKVIVVPRRALFKPVYEENQRKIQDAMTSAAFEQILEYFAGAKTLEVKS